ncbi:hypothetical protein F2Q68_00029506 [Brassica cretica]|nr:hypothetical protein F2Q68_00029506 [Brassica cretica]
MLGRCVAIVLGLSMVRLPYSSLSVAGLDTYLDINFVITVFDPNTAYPTTPQPNQGYNAGAQPCTPNYAV